MAQELKLKPEKPALSGWPMIIFYWAMFVFAIHSATHMVGAGDTWVAMACGRHFINHGVDTIEPFSANSHKAGPTEEEVKTWPLWAQKITDTVGLDTVKYWHPTGWVNQNWLTHVIFYWLTHESPIADAETFDKPIAGQNISYNSLVYWKYALYIITIIVVYQTGKKLGANPALSAAFACFALFVGRTFFDIRPAGFSNMLTAVLLFVYVLAVNRNYLYIWLLVPLTVLWCNLHGGYIYVFITLVPFIGLHLLSILPRRTANCILYSLGWLFFYALTVKFTSHDTVSQFISVQPSKDGLLYFVLVLLAGNLALYFMSKDKIANVYNVISTFIIFLTAISRFYPENIGRALRGDKIFSAYVADSRLTFFVCFIGFLFVALLLGVFKQRLKTLSVKGWWHTVAASAATLVAIVIFNPFHLTNITHTFIVTVSEDAKLWKTVNEWHPAFEWKNPVGDERPFLIMYIVVWILLAFWIFALLLKPKQPKLQNNKGNDNQLPQESNFSWPKIDLPLMSIAAMTIYMAIGSRRFIPVAAIAACPLLAMFIDTGVKMFIIGTDRRKDMKMFIQPMAKPLQYMFISVAVILAAVFSINWGLKYKRVYLNVWPDSYYLTSEFMRMSASYAKPFKACQFIRDNKLSGKVFNYWTEGGFIAYGQIPDANTGKTPLQLFMDGRAQAAYNTAAYNRWMYIMAGGKPASDVQRAGRRFTNSDYKKVGQWLGETLASENVEYVLMPAGQLSSTFVRGLDTNNSWLPIFINDEQKLYANIETQRGKELYIGMFNGQTIFPDEFSKKMTVGYNFLRMKDSANAEKGIDLLIDTFNTKPYQVLAVEIVRSTSRGSEFRDKATEVFSSYFKDFSDNKQLYKTQSGYRERIVSAIIAADYLANVKPADAKEYKKTVELLTDEQGQINQYARW